MRQRSLYPRNFLQPDCLGLAARPSIFGTSRAMRLSLRFSSSLRADGLVSMAYLATQAPALDQVGFDGFQGNAFLLAPPFRDKAVVEILPERPVFAKGDLHGYLAAFLVGQKLNAGHECSSLCGSTHTLARPSGPVMDGVLQRASSLNW